MITILFAYRNRDIDRIDLALQSLQKQTNSDFKVIFIDYGSKNEYSIPLKKLLNNFDFVDYYYIGHPGLLWNKSKAFNYGIKKAKSEYILTADIDLIFNPETIESLIATTEPSSYTLFKYGYLPKKLGPNQIRGKSFSDLIPSHFGEVNGVGLYPKKALETIKGFDEFYHFYGLEDEDLFLRLDIAGFQRQRDEKDLFRHQWHPRYPDKNDVKLTHHPRLRNAMRINQQHYFFCKKLGYSIPLNQDDNRSVFKKEDSEIFKQTHKDFLIDNSSAAVLHFVHEILPSLKGNIISVRISENKEISNLKSRLKRISGEMQQPYLKMKEVNDILLQKIIFDYRHTNYHFSIEEDHKSICFAIDLRGINKGE